MKVLIVNADDFGLTAGVNRGIVESHTRGIVTSTSLMVRQPAAEEAARLAKENPTLGIGLHIDLGEWVYQGGQWQTSYEFAKTDDAAAVEKEIASQLEKFRQLLGRDPTHLDSHQHVHGHEPAKAIATRWAEKLRIPLRSISPHARYVGGFYGQDGEGNSHPQNISVPSLVKLIESLADGVSELGCHPGFADDLNSVYRDERAIEVATLCDLAVRDAVRENAVEIRSFSGLTIGH